MSEMSESVHRLAHAVETTPPDIALAPFLVERSAGPVIVTIVDGPAFAGDKVLVWLEARDPSGPVLVDSPIVICRPPVAHGSMLDPVGAWRRVMADTLQAILS